jgi:hypothetical protein
MYRRAESAETDIIISKAQSLQEKDQQRLAAYRTKIDLSRKKKSNENSNFRVFKSVRKTTRFRDKQKWKKSSISVKKETEINSESRRRSRETS